MFSVLKVSAFLYFFFITGYAQKVDLSQHKDLILKLHNGFRGLQGASNMKKLKWSNSLAKEAEKWVGRCWYQFLAGNHGENMYYSESALPDNVLIERAIDTWYAEKYGWRRGSDCTDACSYTQMVWASTDEVGCAAQRCPKLNLAEEFVNNGWFITCLYDPKGNTLGQMPFESGNPCTLCDIGERCADKLCIGNVPVQPQISVRNRTPPRPKVKPILTFNDVQKRVPRQAFHNWWNMGPVTPSFEERMRQNRNPFTETVQEVVTLKPKDLTPTAKGGSVSGQLIMTESAFGLESAQPIESVIDNKTQSVIPSTSPAPKVEKKNNNDISPVYAQMTMNGPVFSFKSTLFKSHLNEMQHMEKTTRTVEKTTTTSTTTTTTTTTTPRPSTIKVPRWFALRISQQDDPVNQQLPLSNEKRWEQFQKSRGNDSNGKSKEPQTQTIDDSPAEQRNQNFQRPNLRTASSINTKFVFKSAETKRFEEMKAREMTETGVTAFPDDTGKSSRDNNAITGSVSATNVPTPPPNQLLCPDSDSNCKHWSKYCNTNDYVKQNCPGTCNTCPTPPPDPPCPDLDPNCHLWHSYCMQNDYVRDHCFNTCNNCTYAVHVTPPPNGNGKFTVTHQMTSLSTPKPCMDTDQYCPGWKNLCHTDEYVQYHCRKSCSYCK